MARFETAEAFKNAQDSRYADANTSKNTRADIRQTQRDIADTFGLAADAELFGITNHLGWPNNARRDAETVNTGTSGGAGSGWAQVRLEYNNRFPGHDNPITLTQISLVADNCSLAVIHLGVCYRAGRLDVTVNVASKTIPNISNPMPIHFGVRRVQTRSPMPSIYLYASYVPSEPTNFALGYGVSTLAGASGVTASVFAPTDSNYLYGFSLGGFNRAWGPA